MPHNHLNVFAVVLGRSAPEKRSALGYHWASNIRVEGERLAYRRSMGERQLPPIQNGDGNITQLIGESLINK